MKSDEFAFMIVFVGLAAICCTTALLINMGMWEPLNNVHTSSILLALSAYIILDYYKNIRKITSRDKDETE